MILIYCIFAEENSYIVYNSTFVEENKEYVCSETKSDTLHNTKYAKINAERRMPLHTLNCEEKNNSRVECHKGRQNLPNTDNGKKYININFTHLQASLNKKKLNDTLS